MRVTLCRGRCKRPFVPEGFIGPLVLGWCRYDSRGLCHACYTWAERNGTLIDHPRSTWSRDDLLDTYAILRDQHQDVRWPMQRIRLIAPRMGLRPESLRRALERARAAGDPRAAVGAW
jgi:hypothetical protein